MSHTVVHSPIHEAELFLGGEAQHLQSNDRLYQAYTQDHANPLSLYIGQDVATLLANPTVQGQIASKLHSSPNLVQIKVTPQRELFVAKTGTTDFQRIDFEEDIALPEVIAIAEKSQKLYLAMQPSLAPRIEEAFDPRTREWSRGYPTPVSFPETAQLHERIHSLESQLANERLRGDMREMREDIRENRGLLLELLRSRDVRSPAADREIDTLRRQLERTTGQVDRLIDQARDRGLAHSAEMHDLLRENDHLRRVCAGSREDLRELEEENDHLRRAYGQTRHELGTLHEALVSDTTEGALENLRRLERTIDTLREREGTLQEALEVDLPEDMLAKVFEIRGANVELRRQLHDAQGALEEYQERDHQATHEIRRLRHTVSDLNLQFRHDQQLIHRLIQEVKELKTRGAGNEERIEQLTGQLREFHDRLYPSDHETAVATLDCIIDRMNNLSRLEGSLQDILQADGPEDIIQRVLALRESHGELGARLEEAVRGAETLQRRLEESEDARGEFEQRAGELHLALQAEKRTTTALRQELALEKQETARLGAALEEEQATSRGLRRQKGEVERDLEQATREVTRLGALSRDLTEQLRITGEDRDRLGREKDQVQESLRQATHAAEQLGEQLQDVTERLRISEEAGLALKEEVRTLGRRVETLERENATLLEQRNGAREALASLKHTHGQTEKRLRQVEAELLGERDRALDAEGQSEHLRREFSAQKRDLEGQVRDLTAEVREGEKAHGAVTRKLEDAERGLEENRRELRRLDAALREAQASAKHWEGESRKHDGNHREALAANRELQRQHELREASLLQEIQLKGTTVSQAQEELARVSEIARVQGEELVGLQRDLESGRKEFAALELEHQKALGEISHVSGIATDLEQRLATLDQELVEKRDLLAGAKREIEHVGGIVLKQKGQLEDLSAELDRSRAEFKALRSEHSQALEELRAEQETGRALQAKLEQVNRESLDQFAELNALHEEAQQRLLSENQELTIEGDALLKDKDQLEGTLRDSRQEVLRLTSEVAALENANREQESALSAQRETIQDLSGKLARVRREAEERNAAYEKQIAELSQRLTPLEAQQLREELASQKSAVSRLTEELRLERAKATEALEEVGRRASPQETQKRDETIARLEKELRAASSRSEELDSQLSIERAQRIENASQHGDEVSLLRQKLKELQASLQAAEKQVEERLAPEAERELRAQLKAQSATSLELTASLEEATREKARAEREVENLTATLENRGSLSEREIEALKKQLREAEGTALRATQNAVESERRFKEADEHCRQLQDEVLLLKRLNAQLQVDADDAVALRKILADIAMAVGTSEGPSALPGIVRQKIAELQEKHALLETLSDQIIDPMSLARQLDQVELSMLPGALSSRLEEVERLREEHEETLAEVSKKDDAIFALRQELDEASGLLSDHARTQEALRRRESELEVLTGSAERMEQAYKEQVAALKKEVHTLKASVEERQGAVDEFYDKMVTAEEQRDAAIEQRDAARLSVQIKTEEISTLKLRIGSLEKESMGLESEVSERGKVIKRLEAALDEAEISIGEYREQEDASVAEIVELRTINRRQAGLLKANEEELAALRSTVDALRGENSRLKKALERIAAVLKVPFTIDDPEQLAASLEGRASQLKQERAHLQEAFDTHIQFLEVAQSTIVGQREEIEELTQTALAQREEFESQIQALEQEARSLNAHLKEARAQVARYDEELRSAHSLNETISESAAKDRAHAASQQKHLDAQIREMEHALQEREIRYEELRGAHRAAREETARLHERIELTQVQRDIQQAVNAGEVMEVLGAALGADAFSLQLGPRDRALLEVTKNHQDYLTIASRLEEMRALAEETAKAKGITLPAAYDLIRDKYYGRHAKQVSSQIAQINSSPGELNNLNLFVAFFKVTGGVSGITRTREFARLTAVRRVLARLHPERDAERIADLNRQTADLTRGLLRNLMGSIYEATKAGSGVTRYSNFGLHLVMWEDILNNLDASLYVGGDRTRPLKAKDAESLRRTVRQLNVQFHRLMASTHHQTSPGVWVPNE